MSNLPIAIYYEQPNWFKPLFAELARRGTPYVKLFAPDHIYSPAVFCQDLQVKLVAGSHRRLRAPGLSSTRAQCACRSAIADCF